MTSENEFKKLLIIRSRINVLREYWGPSTDKRTVRDLLNLDLSKKAKQDPKNAEMNDLKAKLMRRK